VFQGRTVSIRLKPSALWAWSEPELHKLAREVSAELARRRLPQPAGLLCSEVARSALGLAAAFPMPFVGDAAHVE
jgi:hypothetical protein